jgi:hypothetical protein
LGVVHDSGAVEAGVDVCGDEAWTMPDDLVGGFVEQVDQLLLAVRITVNTLIKVAMCWSVLMGCGH